MSVAVLAAFTGLAAQRVAARPSSGCSPIASVADAALDTRGLAIPLGDPALPLHPGDRVDIVGVTEDVAVLSVTASAAVVAIAPADLAAVVAAVREHGAILALRPSSSEAA